MADYLYLFVVSSYFLAWLVGGTVGITVLSGLFRQRPRGIQLFAAIAPGAILLLVLLFLPRLNQDHKAFYYVYQSISPGMPFSTAARKLVGYPLVKRSGDMLWYRYSPNPSTVDFIVLTVRDDRVVSASYSAD